MQLLINNRDWILFDQFGRHTLTKTRGNGAEEKEPIHVEYLTKMVLFLLVNLQQWLENDFVWAA